MSVQVKHRRDTATNIASFTPAQGEIIGDTTNNRLILGDGATVGGIPMAKLSEAGASPPTRTAVADANYTALTTDRNIAFTSISAARTVTLCAASAYPIGYRLSVFDESGSASATSTITLARVGSDTIDGATSAAISSAYGVLALETNGASKWTIIDQSSSNLAAVGIGTAADPSNPLSVYGASALFNGTNFSFTVNKSASGNTASVLFEDAFSARAQIGLLGNDNFTFKVSPNGSTYYSGLTLNAANGQAQFLAGAAGGASLNVAPGVAPTSPNNGDHWTAATGVFDFVSGVTAAAPLVIGHARVPLILVSSGTMGNNGALSGLTAVATTYPNAYVYMPASAISSGSAAGWYYAVFSSTSAATVYNNTYSGTGTPIVPASPTAFVTTGPGAFTQTTSGVQAFGISVPGGLLGTNGGLRVTLSGAMNNSANAKNIFFKFGGTTIFSTSPTTNTGFGLASGFVNCGSASQQVGLTSGGGIPGLSATPAFAAINTATAQTAAVTIQLANAADTVTLLSATFELLPGLQ